MYPYRDELLQAIHDHQVSVSSAYTPVMFRTKYLRLSSLQYMSKSTQV